MCVVRAWIRVYRECMKIFVCVVSACVHDELDMYFCVQLSHTMRTHHLYNFQLNMRTYQCL